MRTVPPRSSIALLLATVAALAAPAAASAAEGQIVVKYAAGTDARDRSEVLADAGVVRDEALALPGTELVTPGAGTTVGRAIADLRDSDDVAYAEPDQSRRAFDLYPDEAHVDQFGVVPPTATFKQLWALQNTGQSVAGAGTAGADIGAPGAWDVTTGSAGVTVAVVDSGVDRTHPDLFANLVPGYDFAYDDADPTDYDGHGTHVAGTIAARGNNGVGVTGVAWQTSLMPVQALDGEGSGSTSDIVAAYNYAALHGARIVNASFGGTGYSQLERDTIARWKDVLFVAAAGNDSANNDTTPSYPCAYNLANVMCVAASDNQDHIPWWSNYGRTTVDITAPGVNIYSTYRCDSYGYMSGTSMATPEVSGAAALVLAHDPTLKPAAVISLLDRTADRLPVGADAQKVASGGRLDVAAALGVTTKTTTPVSTMNGDGTTTPGRTITVAAPREDEPHAPASACPAAPARTSTGSNAGPTTPVTPANPHPPAQPTAPVAPTPSPTVTPAVDRTAPTIAAALTGRGALRTLLAGRLRVAATVSERATVRLELRVDARTAKRLHLSTRSTAVAVATASTTLTKAGKRSVTLRVTSRAKRALAHVRTAKVALRATATDTAGNARTRSRALTITR